jgi:hypothetical protein
MELAMKKSYIKPVLAKREKLAAISAIVTPPASGETLNL